MNSILENIIKQSFEHYDKQNEKYKNFIKCKNDFTFQKMIDSDVKKNKKKDRTDLKPQLTTNTVNLKQFICFFDNKKYIFEFETLGLFLKKTNIWIWGWSFTLSEKIQFDIIRQLLNYGLDIEIKENVVQNDKSYEIKPKYLLENIFLKSKFINSRFQLDKEIDLELILALSSYLLKDKIKFIFPYKKKLNLKDNIILYYLII